LKKFRGIYLKNEKEIDLMREANRIVSVILDRLAERVAPGVATMEFERIARRSCEEFKVKPAFLGYLGYPFALCCSVNEEVVHGFPSDSRVLAEGDIVSFDMGAVFQGFYGDSARTYPVGKVSGEAQRLLEVTRESLYKGIEQAKCGNSLYDISAAVQKHVEANGFSVVRRFVGHGVGRNLHEKPEVPNFVPRGMPDLALRSGMVLAIEPMVCVGTHEVDILSDNWTAVTRDRKLSAHFEHSVALWPQGPEILGRTS
jgi:methionyl aminopeptidase